MADDKARRVVIIGATSGIGRRLAEMYLERGHIVGISGRRGELLTQITDRYPERAFAQVMDVKKDAAPEQLDELVARMGGMDVFLYSAGIGSQNAELKPDVELSTLGVNAIGFTALTVYAYNYFKERRQQGHIAVISSMAAVKALHQAPAYSATKRFNAHYISCLAKKARHDKADIKFTTIMPGFIKTDLLKHDYPMMVTLNSVAPLIFRGIEKRKRILIVPGRWRWVNAGAKLIPNWLWERV